MEYLQVEKTKRRKLSADCDDSKPGRNNSAREHSYAPERLNAIEEILAAAKSLLSPQKHRLFVQNLVSYSERRLDAPSLVQRIGEVLVEHPSLLSDFKDIVQLKYRKYLNIAQELQVVQEPSTAKLLATHHKENLCQLVNENLTPARLLAAGNLQPGNEAQHESPHFDQQVHDRYRDAKLIVGRLGRLQDTNRQLYSALSVILRRFRNGVTVPEHAHRCLCILLEDEPELVEDIVTYTGFAQVSRNDYPPTARNLILMNATEEVLQSEVDHYRILGEHRDRDIGIAR